MVDASTAKQQRLLDPMKGLRQAPHLSLAQHAQKPLAIFNCRALLHFRENGFGDLKMAVSLASLDFRDVG